MTQKQFTIEDFPLEPQFSVLQEQPSLTMEQNPMEDCQDIMFTFSNKSRKMSLDLPYSQQDIQSQQFAEQTNHFFQLKTQQNTNFAFTLPANDYTQQFQEQEEEEKKIAHNIECNQEESSTNENSQEQSLFDLSNPFDPFNADQQQQQPRPFEDVIELTSNKLSSRKIFQTVVPKKQPKKKGNYDKNICRYLTRKVIRCFASSEYKEKALSFAKYDEDLYFEATEFFLRRIEKITGFRVLKQYLQIPKLSEIAEDGDEAYFERQYSIIFKRFYLWFLKERMNRYILNGKMEDKQMYIRYKNEVMLNYSEALDSWTSNKNLKKKERRK